MTEKLPAESHIGRVALAVESFDTVLPFYRETLGFEVERENGRVALTAGGQALVVLEEAPAAPPRPSDAAGLFHLAVRVPDRPSLADVLVRAREQSVKLTGASDHRVSEALYVRDPEGNGIEVTRDRPRESWPETDDGSAGIDTLTLDCEALAADATGEARLPAGTDIGHVNLETCDLERAEAFYHDILGLRVRDRYGEGATFLAAGEYHHHVGLNTWNHRTAPASGTRGLRWFEVVVPDQAVADAVRERLRNAEFPVTVSGDGFGFTDPDSVEVRVVVRS